ncbi:hypothetical protein EDB81DRAFT_840170 [Dactylonectria macrodidyma]|uniref:CFEM domain-containing protein n=1 Tax=Dactylonectria macrodidyma TaxID=307937 RepID=A0A9P9F9K6_9HYPO|nr:hypothetical protein EDB81DRAFT_840170 [Dactylonectria macrodidyma]
MRASWLFFGLDCLAALPQLTLASSLVLTEMPDCACFTTAVAHSTCNATNQTCVCFNQALQTEAMDCVAESCTLKESLVTTNLSMTACDVPVRDNSRAIVTGVITLTAISALFVVQRFFSKIFWRAGIDMDDWCILLAYLVCLTNTLFVICGAVRNGLGRDIWTLSPAEITAFGIYFYAGGLCYLAVLTFLKISLLLFYLRIFPTRSVRRILWGTVILNAAVGIAFFLAFAFQCHPVSYFWYQWDGEHEGQCTDSNVTVWTHAALGITIDIWMLAVPLSQLRSLNLDWKKKVGVGIMFCVGAFMTVISIIRLHSLIKFSLDVANPTHDFVSATTWSVVEMNVGIMCACLPSLRYLLVRLFPRFLGTSRDSEQYHSGQTGRVEAGRSSNRGTNLGSHARTTVQGKTSQQRNNTKANISERIYGLEFGDNDETNLVSMTDLDRGSARSNVSL